MNADGSGQTRLTNNAAADVLPAWAPDGNKIAFESNRTGNFQVYVMNADGSGQTRLTNNAASDGGELDWSPDGTKIAFQSNRDGNIEVYSMNSDGSGQTRLTNNAADDGDPSWSPDGKQIAFASTRDGNTEVYVMNADGSGQTRLTNNAATDALPAWSPDGKKIAFESYRDGNLQVYVMNADGSEQTRLTNNAADDFLPAWSPDGKKIAFEVESNHDGNHLQVYVMNADGSGRTALTNGAASDVEPDWGIHIGGGGTTTTATTPTTTSATTTTAATTTTTTGTTSTTAAPTPIPKPVTPVVTPSTPKTYSEQVSIHHVVHTFANYHNASGQGPDLGIGQFVQVSCKVYDPSVVTSVAPDGYWYRIASSPWNNTYYAGANTFMNGDPPNGPYTHNTDFAVPNCSGSSGATTSTTPRVTLAKGPAAPFGFRYAVSVGGFPANAGVAISCRDSVDPGGFFNFDMKTNGNGSASVQNQCYSADGPDHWVVADGKYTSNRVQWGSGTAAAKPPPTSTSTNPPSVAGPKAPKHLWIVTLGDSYTAGDGAGANYDSCNRSYNSYPWLYMNLLRGAGYGADIWQAACSGATTSDVVGQLAQMKGSPAAGRNADVVFITIGGNDFNFHDIVLSCLVPYHLGVLKSLSFCTPLINSAIDKFSSVLETTSGLLKVIAQQMPNAQVVLVGYPPLTSPNCPATPWNQTIGTAQNTFDVDQRTLVTKLNQSQATTRFHFVSVAQAFSGHGPCAALSAQYVNGATGTIQHYHPNVTGNQVIATLLYSAGVQKWVG